MKFTPHEYQQRGASFLVSRPEAALFWEPGLGKSSVTLTAVQALRRAGAVRKALIVAPLRVCYQVWSEIGELGKGDDFRDLRVSLLHGPKKAEALAADADLYVINYDGLAWLTEAGRIAGLIKRGVDLVVFDELSKLKHSRTQRFRLIKPWLGQFRRRWGLTGTPVANGLLDLFGQCYALDLGAALGRFITHYRQKYFVPAGYGGYTWVPQHDAEARIFAAIAPLAQSLKAADCLELPELVERDVFVELPAEARTVYRKLEDDLIAVVNDVTVTAANKAVALGKCRQVCGGALYHGDDHQWLPVHEAKLEALLDLIDELQGQPGVTRGRVAARDRAGDCGVEPRGAAGAAGPPGGGGARAQPAARRIARVLLHAPVGFRAVRSAVAPAVAPGERGGARHGAPADRAGHGGSGGPRGAGAQGARSGVTIRRPPVPGMALKPVFLGGFSEKCCRIVFFIAFVVRCCMMFV